MTLGSYSYNFDGHIIIHITFYYNILQHPLSLAASLYLKIIGKIVLWIWSMLSGGWEVREQLGQMWGWPGGACTAFFPLPMLFIHCLSPWRPWSLPQFFLMLKATSLCCLPVVPSSGNWCQPALADPWIACEGLPCHICLGKAHCRAQLLASCNHPCGIHAPPSAAGGTSGSFQCWEGGSFQDFIIGDAVLPFNAHDGT